ncbi:hypothetical protein D3C81_1373530 [compost metagenome]
MLGQAIVACQIRKSLMGDDNLIIRHLGKLRLEFSVQSLQSLSKLVIALLIALFMLRIYSNQTLFNILRHDQRRFRTYPRMGIRMQTVTAAFRRMILRFFSFTVIMFIFFVSHNIIHTLADFNSLGFTVAFQTFQEIRHPSLKARSIVQEQLCLGGIDDVLAARRPVMGLHPNRQQIDRINIFSANFTGKFIYGIKSCDHVYFTLDNIPAAFSAAGCEH